MKMFEDSKQLFKKLYLRGKTVEESAMILKIPSWKCYEWKEDMGLCVEKWQRDGMPKKFSNNTRETLLGTILGDGYLEHTGNCKYKKFGVSHCLKQKKYIEWLQTLLSELKPSHIFKTGDKWGTLGFYTPPHPQFDEMYNICYPDGIKQITQKWVEGLSPLSLALWYTDDGSVQQKGQMATIATCSFNKKSISIISNYLLDKWNIKTKLRQYKTDNNYPRICMDLENATKFYNIIKPHIHESMRFKFARFIN